MSEEIVAGQEHDEHDAEIVHEDIMQRLLDYQRQLRTGASPGEALGAVSATKTETDVVVDLTQAEAEMDPVALVARVAELEGTIARVSAMIAELRGRFQEMAVESDERLAAVAETLSKASGSGSV